MLSKKEQDWVKKVQKVLDSCPISLRMRADSYTIGDRNITVFDKNKFVYTGDDVCIDVDSSNAELVIIRFPFGVASSSG